jgi:hypothetical protein
MRLLSGLLAGIGFLAAGVASAQSIPFTILATANGNATTIPNGATLSLSTTVGTQAQVAIQATYTGSSQATFPQSPAAGLLGSTEITVTSTQTFPLVLNPGDSLKYIISFAPTDANGAQAFLNIPFTQPGAGGVPVQSTITMTVVGTTPQFTLSYILQTNPNVVKIESGGTIPFDPTLINTTAAADLNITNTGSGPGQITAITQPPASSPFKLQNIPLLPVNLASGASIQLLVLYKPTVVGNDSASIQITFQGGATATVNLTGSGATSSFSYTVLAGGTATPVPPLGTITLPATSVGIPSSVIVKVTNKGNANGTINSISISGVGFVLQNVPVTLPTLKPGETFSFSIQFTPTGIGPESGQLVIGSDFFNLSGEGLGPQLTFASGSIAVDPAKGVVFSPVAVGKSEQVTFTITNSGSLPATIFNIGPNPASGPYSVSGLPALPLTLTPKQSAHFTIKFTPTVVGFTSGALVVDTTTIPLIGSGTAPPTLPSYTLGGPSGNVEPQSQSNFTLTLSKGYSLDLTGTLTLTTQGNFGTDPSVQFATGGRTVNFTIPANSASANFAGQGSELLLQTGTVAETVTLTPSFTTSGGVNVTPASPTVLQFTVPSAAPVLLRGSVANQTTNSFDLVLVGYSTTRSLTTLNVSFTAAPGFTINTSVPPIDLGQVSSAWFQSLASIPFGGQFLITMPFTLTGPVKTGQTLIQSIASVSATVSNSIGASNQLTQIAVQ